MTEAGISNPTLLAKKKNIFKKKEDKPIFVVKVKSIPFGFFEEEILKYFSQFGKVIRVRVSRNKKTGNHKGWAYVGFDNKEVAEIAAEAMNGYLMFEKRIRCHVMDVVPGFMKTGPVVGPRPHNQSSAKQHSLTINKQKPEEQISKSLKKRKHKEEKQAQKLREMGIDYDLSTVPSYTTATVAKPSEVELVAVVDGPSKSSAKKRPIVIDDEDDVPVSGKSAPTPRKSARMPKALELIKAELAEKAANTPKKATATPAKAPATPAAKAPATPAPKAAATPAPRAAATPAPKAPSTPVRNTRAAAKTPAKVELVIEDDAPEVAPTPAKTPARAARTTKAAATPAKPAATPAKAVKTPAKVAKTPAKTTKTPAKAAATPAKPVETSPSKTAATPGRATRSSARNAKN